MKPISEMDTDFHVIYWDEKIIPFGQLRFTPIGEDTLIITDEVFSCLADKSPMYYLMRYLKEKGYLSKIVKKSCSAFPFPFVGKYLSDGVMLVGDAAGQGNPIYGGGILHAMDAGELAGATAVEACEEDDFSSDFLSRYEENWWKLYGKRNHMERIIRAGAVPMLLHNKIINKLIHNLEDTDCVFTDKLLLELFEPLNS